MTRNPRPATCRLDLPLCDIDCVSFARTQLKDEGLFASYSKCVVCFNKCFAGKDFGEISTFCKFIMLCNFRAEQICIHVLECTVSSATKINRSVGSMLEFQQNEPQNRQKIVTLMNNKLAAIPKTIELPWRVNF